MKMFLKLKQLIFIKVPRNKGHLCQLFLFNQLQINHQFHLSLLHNIYRYLITYCINKYLLNLLCFNKLMDFLQWLILFTKYFLKLNFGALKLYIIQLNFFQRKRCMLLNPMLCLHMMHHNRFILLQHKCLHWKNMIQ